MGFVTFYCLLILRFIRNFNRAYFEVSERLCSLIERKIGQVQKNETIATSDQREVDALIGGDELFNRTPDLELNVLQGVSSSQNDRQTQTSRGKLLICNLGAKTGTVTVRYCKSEADDSADCSSDDEEDDNNCATVQDHFVFVDFDKLPYDKVKANWNLNVDSASSFKVFKPKNKVNDHKIENESISETSKDSESEGWPGPHSAGHDSSAPANREDFPKFPNSEFCKKSLDSPETRKNMPEHDTSKDLSYESSVKAPAEAFEDMVLESSDEVRKQTALGTTASAVHGVGGYDFPAHEPQKDMQLETPVNDRHDEVLLKSHAHEVCEEKLLNFPAPEVSKDEKPESEDVHTELFTHESYENSVFEHPYENRSDKGLESSVTKVVEGMEPESSAHKVLQDTVLESSVDNLSEHTDLEFPVQKVHEDAGLKSSVRKVLEEPELECSKNRVSQDMELDPPVHSFTAVIGPESPLPKESQDTTLKQSVRSFTAVIGPESPLSKVSQDMDLESSVHKVSEDTDREFSLQKVNEDVALEYSVHKVSEDTDREFPFQKFHEDVALESSFCKVLEKPRCSTNRVTEDMELEPPVHSIIAVFGPESPLPKVSQDTELDSSVHKVSEDTDLEFPVQKVHEDVALESSICKLLEKPELECSTSRVSEDMELEPPVHSFIVVTEPESPLPKVSEDTDFEFASQKDYEDRALDSLIHIPEDLEFESSTHKVSEHMQQKSPAIKVPEDTKLESPARKDSEDIEVESPARKVSEDVAVESPARKVSEDIEVVSPARKNPEDIEYESPAREVLEDTELEFSARKVLEDMELETLARQVPQDIGNESSTTEIRENIHNKSTEDLDGKRAVLPKQFKFNLRRTRSKSLSETSSERLKSSELSSEEKLADKEIDENLVDITLKNIELVADSLADASKGYLKQVNENSSYNLPSTDKKAYVLGSDFLTTALDECQVLKLLHGDKNAAFMKSDLENLNALIDELKSMEIAHCNQTENSPQQDESAVINNTAQENNLVSSYNQSVTSPSNKAVEKNACLMLKCSEKETQTPLNEWKTFCRKPKNSPIIPCDRSSFYELISIVFDQNIQSQSSNSGANSIAINSSNFRTNNPKRFRPSSPPPDYDEAERYFESLLDNRDIKNASASFNSESKNTSTIDNNAIKNAILSALNINKTDVDNALGQTADTNAGGVVVTVALNTGEVVETVAVNTGGVAEAAGVSTGRDVKKQDSERNQILEEGAQRAEGADDTSKLELDEMEVSDKHSKKRKRSKWKGNKKCSRL